MIEKNLGEMNSNQIGQGLGLGLFICKRIGVMIDGLCSVNSVPNDETTFIFEVTAPSLVSRKSCNQADGI
jgi:signal transduction histidine kinase